MPENAALWQSAKRSPLAVGPPPHTRPRAEEIVVGKGLEAISAALARQLKAVSAHKWVVTL